MKMRTSKMPSYKVIAGVVAVGVLAIVAIVVAVIVKNNSQTSDVESGESGETAVYMNVLTEEDKKTTSETMDDVEINIEGRQQFSDENGEHNGVVVTVKNTGKEKTNIAIDLVAKDDKGEILDKSSLYAEGIEPEQTQKFYLFVYSKLSAEQLNKAKFEVYKAYTYKTDVTE